MCDTCGCGVPGAAAEETTPRVFAIERSVLAANDRVAEGNRALLAARRAFAVNLISSPGAGKTTLLEQLIPRLGGVPHVVVEGDVETTRDAERIARLGVPVHAIETRGGCHLTATHVRDALAALEVPRGAVVWVENVGNLVCPAGFDLGEHLVCTLLSAAEGDDKPVKYPAAFRRAGLVVLSKVDIAEPCGFDREACRAWIHRVNPAAAVHETSSVTGAGLDGLAAALAALRERAQQGGAERGPRP